MKLYWPITKVDAELREVEGYASTEALDSQNEIVKREAIERALSGYMEYGNIREMHTSSAVGVAKDATMDDKGLYIRVKIVDPLAWEKVREGVYKGFSIGGRVTNRDPVNKSTITGIHLTEISLVDRPANPEARFSMWKADGAEPAAEGESSEGKAPETKLEKGMYAVGLLAGIIEQLKCVTDHSKIEEAAEGDTKSVVPDELQSALEQLSGILNDMVAEETAEITDTGEQNAQPELAALELAEQPADVEKRDYTAAERKAMAAKKEALPDGSFPIANRKDLENAISAYGRAKDPAAAKAHIEQRAKDLGAEDLIPETWKADVVIDLEKAGRRNSSSDQAKLNAAHDAIVAAGADCASMKSDHDGDLAKARDDLAHVATSLAETQASVVTLTKSRDEATDALTALTKAHETVTAERDEITKRHDALVTEKAALDTENAALKAELEELKAKPEPIKGKLTAFAKGEDIGAPKKAFTTAAPVQSAQQERWFTTRHG